MDWRWLINVGMAGLHNNYTLYHTTRTVQATHAACYEVKLKGLVDMLFVVCVCVCLMTGCADSLTADMPYTPVTRA